MSSQSIDSILASITSLEAYAAGIVEADSASRTGLLRIIRALARIAHAKSPFPRMATRYQDEDGHYDNSFPPKQQYRDHTGPMLHEVVCESTEDIATTSGFYYEWRRATDDAGLYVATDGSLYGCTTTGTGRLGQFAAHPGDCDVDVTLSWGALDTDEVPLDRLQKAVRGLIAMAFPTAKDRAAAKALVS